MKMLKRIAMISGVLLAAALVVSLVLAPRAVRDVLGDRERIAARLMTSSPVYTYDGNYYSEVHVDLGNAQILVEQSQDESIYFRVESLLASKLEAKPLEREVDGRKVLDVRLNSDEAFFDVDNTSYLFWLGATQSDLTSIVLRVPPSVSVTTADSPWRVDYRDGVQFANRAYYDGQLWDAQEREEREALGEAQQRLELLQEKLGVLLTGLTTELDGVLAETSGDDSRRSKAPDESIDELVRAYYQRMDGQIFPYESEIYDQETLSALLRNCLNLTGNVYKARFRLEQSDGDVDVSQEYDRLQQRNNESWEAFREMYDSYLRQGIQRELEAGGEASPAGDEPLPAVSEPEPAQPAGAPVAAFPAGAEETSSAASSGEGAVAFQRYESFAQSNGYHVLGEVNLGGEETVTFLRVAPEADTTVSIGCTLAGETGTAGIAYVSPQGERSVILRTGPGETGAVEATMSLEIKAGEGMFQLTGEGEQARRTFSFTAVGLEGDAFIPVAMKESE